MSGFYTLDRGTTVRYVGQQIEDYNRAIILKSAYSTGKKEVFFLVRDTDMYNKILVYNRDFNRWSVIDPRPDLINDICVHNGELIAVVNGQLREEGELPPAALLMYKKTSKLYMDWFNLNDLQGYLRLRRINVLYQSNYYDDVTIICRIYYNYRNNDVSESFEIKPKNPDNVADRDTNRIIRLKPKRQKCSAFKLEFEATDNKAFTISGLTLEYAMISDNIFKGGPSGSRA